VKSSTRTSDFFDSYAHDFSAIYGTGNNLLNRIVNRLFRRSMMLRYMHTLEGCDPVQDKSVIDIGCGPGHYGIAVARKGAGRVLGIDFAPGMVDLARKNAQRAGVQDVCTFECADFMTYPADDTFDYAILMGFMDYVADPREVIAKVVSIASSRAFFSFPAEGGLLAWQRKLRYMRKCDLYLYTRGQLEDLFAGLPGTRAEIRRIARDFFVTAEIAS
jgi:2-polyprenyl-3-methyl-5-hydroxy-6-metoxy-1,4-benzoquinol methylase